VHRLLGRQCIPYPSPHLPPPHSPSLKAHMHSVYYMCACPHTHIHKCKATDHEANRKMPRKPWWRMNFIIQRSMRDTRRLIGLAPCAVPSSFCSSAGAHEQGEGVVRGLAGHMCMSSCAAPHECGRGHMCMSSCAAPHECGQGHVCMSSCAAPLECGQGHTCMSSCAAPHECGQGHMCMSSCAAPHECCQGHVCMSSCAAPLECGQGHTCMCSCVAPVECGQGPSIPCLCTLYHGCTT